MPDDGHTPNLWMIYALMTVACWGVYGILLHTGQIGMRDPINGRYKAFLWVGIAYVLVAVLAPLAMLIVVNGASWDDADQRPVSGRWSPVSPARSARSGCCSRSAPRATPPSSCRSSSPARPIVNAIVSSRGPPAGRRLVGLNSGSSYAGIVLAACGGMLVTLYKPAPGQTTVVHRTGPATLTSIRSRALSMTPAKPLVRARSRWSSATTAPDGGAESCRRTDRR